MKLDARNITAEEESYPDYPPDFPMPPTITPPVNEDEAAGIFNDPPNNERDAEALKNVTSDEIVKAYRRMGAQFLMGKTKGKNWRPCVGGDFNCVTGHWRELKEPGAGGGYRLLTIFEIASREDIFQTVHDARLKLFSSEFLQNAKSIPPKCVEDLAVPSTIENARLSEIRTVRKRLGHAQEKLKTVRTPFGYSVAIYELDDAITDMCKVLDKFDPEPVGAAKSMSSSTAEQKEKKTVGELSAVGHNEDAQRLTLEELDLSKAMCNSLKKAGVNSFDNILNIIGPTKNWDLLTKLPGVGKAKVESIRGAYEKLTEANC